MENKSLGKNNLPSKKTEKKKYKKYSYSLKREVVYQVVSGKMFVNQARIHYDIRGKTLINSWIKKYGLLFYNPKQNYDMGESPEQTIKKLKLDIEQLQLEKDILLDIQHIYIKEYGVDAKKFLSQQLNVDLEKHIKKAKKKGL
jgi:transposase-like protein